MIIECERKTIIIKYTTLNEKRTKNTLIHSHKYT